jgi:DNA-binding SARP family transcriptional activator
LRSDYHRRYREVRLRLAELPASGPEAGLNRAEELYSRLCAEDPEDERLWMALFQIYARTDDELRLNSAVRRLRGALAELETGEVQDIETLPLPANL